MPRGRKGPEDYLLDLYHARFAALIADFKADEGRRPTDTEIGEMSRSAAAWARDELEGERYDTHPRV